MCRRQSQYLVWLTLTVIALGFLFLISIESWMLAPTPVPPIPSDARAGLHETAVAGLLDQSGVFSQWSIALIIGAWITIVGTDPVAPGRISLFLIVCAACLLTLFLGQALVQRVIFDIQSMKDPLQNDANWQFLAWQFRSTAIAALLVAIMIGWRYRNA